MNHTTRILTAIAGAAAIAIPAVFPEGWEPMLAGAGGLAAGLSAAIFGRA